MNKSDKKEEIYRHIQLLNSQIETFVRNTLDLGGGQAEDGAIDMLPGQSPKQLPRCWEVKQCNQANCPAYNNEDYRCWLFAGTMCGGSPQGIFAQKYNSCYQCNVFQQFNDTTVNKLHENIGILIKHLGDKIRQLRECAVRDSLTGLYNRHYLNMIHERETGRAARKKQPLSVIIFDLNKFKEVNDRWGHLTGDELLKEFSNFLMACIRTEDLLFRLGGDEFMLLMVDINLEQRKAVETRLFEEGREWNLSQNKLPVALSFSLGGATGIGPIKLESLMDEADRAMYAQKQSNHMGSQILDTTSY